MHDHHRHHHGHTHGHGPGRDGHRSNRRRLSIVLALTSTFMVVEFVGGWLANSLALIADAGHMLGDVAALGLSLFALRVSQRPATPEKSYGYHRFEILAALANGVALAAIAIVIFVQAWARLRQPEPVEGGLMLTVAIAGLSVNVFAAFALHAASGHNLNVRGAYLHVLGDLLGSVGAITAAIIVITTGWTPADPIISCLVASLILVGSWRLIRESVDILLEAVPRDIDLAAVRKAILDVPPVEAVHDLHVWTLTSGYRAMSGHAIITDPSHHATVLEAIHHRMHEDFGIDHVTVQVEYPPMVHLTPKPQPQR
jgi:cobalt-zinc-cadmium efflux system protein